MSPGLHSDSYDILRLDCTKHVNKLHHHSPDNILSFTSKFTFITLISHDVYLKTLDSEPKTI